MPQILGKDNSKFYQTIASQAESEYYKKFAMEIFWTISQLLTYRWNYVGNDKVEKFVNPSQEDIDDVMYEFSNDMVPNELLIIVKVAINNKHRLLTDKEIYHITKMYEEFKKHEKRRKH